MGGRAGGREDGRAAGPDDARAAGPDEGRAAEWAGRRAMKIPAHVLLASFV